MSTGARHRRRLIEHEASQYPKTNLLEHSRATIIIDKLTENARGTHKIL